MGEKVKVLYIAGAGRSGSTIIERILDQIHGITSVGEICFIWDRGLLENNFCSCTKPFNQCEHWEAVLQEAFGNKENIDPKQLQAYYDVGARYHQLPRMMLPGAKEGVRKKNKAYLDVLGKLYTSLQEVTQAEIIVDSSKFPTYGYLLDLIPDVELYVLQIVRDSRAVAYSWQRKKEYQPDIQMIRFNPIISSMLWNVYNFSSEYFWGRKAGKFFRVRYEDFINNPQNSLSLILSWLKIEGEELPFIDENEVWLESSHCVAGNPSRFAVGEVKLVYDSEWFEKMGLLNKVLVSILTFPLLIRYGYFKLPKNLFSKFKQI